MRRADAAKSSLIAQRKLNCSRQRAFLNNPKPLLAPHILASLQDCLFERDSDFVCAPLRSSWTSLDLDLSNFAHFFIRLLSIAHCLAWSIKLTQLIAFVLRRFQGCIIFHFSSFLTTTCQFQTALVKFTCPECGSATNFVLLRLTPTAHRGSPPARRHCCW